MVECVYPSGSKTMTNDITAEIEAAEGRTVRVISSPSTLDRTLHGAETTEYEATVTGVTTTGGEAGVSEMQKLTVEDEDGEEHRIDVSAWGEEIEDSDDLEVAVQPVEEAA